MPDIVIHRCTLRIVRRSGWAWGPHPQRLLQAAVRALPELLAARLAAMWLTNADREIADPVRLTVRLQMSELSALVLPPAGGVADETSELPQALGNRIEAALRTALAQETVEPHPIAHEEGFTQSPAVSEEETRELAEAAASSVPRLLLVWRERGLLGERLGDFPLAVLESWHRCLLNDVRTSFDPPVASEETIEDLIAAVAQRVNAASVDRATLLRWRIALTVEAMARFNLSLAHPALRSILQRWFPFEDTARQAPAISTNHHPGAEPTRGEQTVPGSSPAAMTRSKAPVQRLFPARVRRDTTERYAPSALPFLLLIPLGQTGWLELLKALLEAAELLPSAQCLAAALSYKVLAPPERGWRRTPAATAAAQAFAATDEPMDETALVDFARRVTPHLAPLDALIADSLSRGHDPRQPLLTQRAGDGWVLFDCEGGFPIAWVDDAAKLIPLIERLSASVVLIPQPAAEPELMRLLQDASVDFVTSAPPARGERWRRLRTLDGERWWTNHHTAAEGELIRAARLLASTAADGDLLWEELAVRRLAVPLAADAAFDRSLTLAASVALGTIAWELWREREPVAPHLALERFSDLDALVCYSARTVIVRLPLGRRFQDLKEHGFLNDVSGVPWLHGRTLRFSSS